MTNSLNFISRIRFRETHSFDGISLFRAQRPKSPRSPRFPVAVPRSGSRSPRATVPGLPFSAAERADLGGAGAVSKVSASTFTVRKYFFAGAKLHRGTLCKYPGQKICRPPNFLLQRNHSENRSLPTWFPLGVRFLVSVFSLLFSAF